MGHLFSRAIKRFTQCSSGSGRNQLPAQQQQEAAAAAQQQRDQESRPTVQSIPVGQSIDSAEYAALEANNKGAGSSAAPAAAAPVATGPTKPLEKDTRLIRAAGPKEAVIKEEDENEAAAGEANEQERDKENDERRLNEPGRADGPVAARLEQNKPDVEEAVIKIQALVRGHLARKALKDAQQQAATPAPNAIGQSQFDEASLMKNPPSPIFLNAATNFSNDLLVDQISKVTSPPVVQSRVPPLESIAEDTESASMSAATDLPQATGAASAQPPPAPPSSSTSSSPPPQPASPSAPAAATTETTTTTIKTPEGGNQRRKLSPINRSLVIPSPSESRSGSLSPAPSEAAASIDLDYDLPTSASIDIMDHNIKPADPMASVLHHKTLAPAAESMAAAEGGESSGPGAVAAQSPLMVVEPPQTMEAVAQPAGNGAGLADDLGAAEPSQQPVAAASSLATIQNSHSIDSAEAAAIRIQSAFRGYHTRKHSPYRRRSPGTMAASPPLSLDSGLSNGHGASSAAAAAMARRSPLRQQNATDALDEVEAELDDLAEAAAAASAATAAESVDTSARRASRQRQRLDTDDSQASQQSSTMASADPGGALASAASTQDEASENTCISMLALDSDTSPASGLSNQRANLTAGSDGSSSLKGELPGEGVSSAKLQQQQQQQQQLQQAAVDQNLSIEMDTESSNLGAALSLNEDLSESEAGVARAVEQQKQAGNEQQVRALEERSFGANLVPDELSSEAQRFVDQLVNEDERELDKATSQLEAALEEATGGQAVEPEDLVAENLAAAILDEEQQRTIEMDSDDIEHRDPLGQGEAQAEEEAVPRDQARLAVESPDEAIGSGRSSPALASSNAPSGSSGDEGEEEEAGETRPPGGRQMGQAQQAGGNKHKRKNRNRKKGKK